MWEEEREIQRDGELGKTKPESDRWVNPWMKGAMLSLMYIWMFIFHAKEGFVMRS